MGFRDTTKECLDLIADDPTATLQPSYLSTLLCSLHVSLAAQQLAQAIIEV